MPKGGARTRSGPAPDPTALRRDRDAGEWTILPAEGRQGATPDWPLTAQAEREEDLWEDLWAKPQALVWERYGQEVEVALYVRRLVEAEERGAAAVLTTLVRQMADSLGLTTPGMRANRWRIDRGSEQDETPAAPGAVPDISPTSARARLRAVSGGSG
ncbi:hypothetical protein [Streptomyces sp. OR43]|uniref:hypothetical protein n=1 Tax=Streptomyces sp. or43 TaxID=2478957 RepID=UPI0011CD4D9F|nr:hypothetical protein [Streptomyces sp. or43]TXS39272.1 hypothetical protein EAO72_19105 [Streptomyces sp. or43]